MKSKYAWLVTLCAALFGSASWFDAVKAYLFCRPAAWGIARLTGGELHFAGTEAVVQTERLRLLIPPSCAGFNFFLILCALLLWNRSDLSWRIPLIAYPVTLAVNCVRIIAVSRWEVYAAPALPLPTPFQHQLIGMTIFLSALILVNLLLQKEKDIYESPPGTV